MHLQPDRFVVWKVYIRVRTLVCAKNYNVKTQVNRGVLCGRLFSTQASILNVFSNIDM